MTDDLTEEELQLLVKYVEITGDKKHPKDEKS